MKNTFLFLCSLGICNTVFSQTNLPEQIVEYKRALETYHQTLDFNEVLGNNLRGGNVISLDSIVHPLEDGRRTVVRYIFNGNQYERVSYNTFEFGDLVWVSGQAFEYNSKLEAINYFKLDLNSGMEFIDRREVMEYDSEGRLIMLTVNHDVGTGLEPELKFEFNYFRNVLFRVISSEYDSISGKFIPRGRVVYDRIPDGEFNAAEIDTFNQMNSVYGRRGFAEYERQDNQIKEQFFYYNQLTDEYEWSISHTYVLSPFNEFLESRETERDSYRQKTEFKYDVEDRLAARVEEYNSNPLQVWQDRFDYAYDFSRPESDLILPPGLAGEFYDGFIGIGHSLDPNLFHHKLDYIRERRLGPGNMVHFDGIIDYFWSDDALTSTTNTESGTIEIFPNPTSDIVNLVLDDQQEYNLQVYDVFGNQMEYKEVVGSTELQVSHWPSGTYILRAQLADGTTLQSIFVKK